MALVGFSFGALVAGLWAQARPQRVDRLVLRHQELKRTGALIEQQLAAVTAERDSLRSRLAAARARIDALLERLPAETTEGQAKGRP